MIFVLTLDTEADNQWDHGVALRTSNVQYWEPFQAVCDKYGIVSTYLVTSEIAGDPSAQGLLRDWTAAGTAEVGAHLHPWTTGPFRDESGLRFNDPAHAFLTELPEDLVREKLKTLTREIEAGFGVQPKSFRAGRFGLDVRCAAALADLGYLVDTSVTPLIDATRYTGLPRGKGGPDFVSHDPRPFLIEGTKGPGLLEVPVTIVPTYRALRRSPRLLRAYRSVPMKMLRRALLARWLCPQPVWLRPAPEYRLSDLQAVYRYQRQNADVCVMMFHSSELMPGGSPYRPTGQSVQELLELLDAFFAFLRREGAIPATLSQAGALLRSSGGLSVRSL